MDFLTNKTVLVCGGSGFMGSNFIHYILSKNSQTRVINLDLLTYAGNEENLKGVPADRYRFVRGDIADVSLVKGLMKDADFVVNFAAETHVDRSIHSDADDFIHTNIVGTHSLLKALKDSPNVLKMVHISTDEVWGDMHIKSKERFTEHSPMLPNSPYSASKAAAEVLIRSYCKTFGLPVVVSRSVNNFGPRQFPEKLIPFFAMLAINDKPLPIHGSGQNVREWIHVDDHTRAVVTLLEKATPGEVYGVSANEECANIDVARKILQALRKPESLITFVEDRPANDRRYAVDPSKLMALGWKPKHTLDSEIPSTITWYQENRDWLVVTWEKYKKLSEHMQISSEDIRNKGLAHSRMSSLSIVFPCLNAKGTIATMVLEGRRIAKMFTNDFEIIVSDDHSTDGSPALLLGLKKSVPELKVILNNEKRGYGAVLKDAFGAASKEFIFYTDGEGQYDVEDLAAMLKKMNDNVDIIVGYHYKRIEPLSRFMISETYRLFLKWFFRIPIRDPDCEFRLFRRAMISALTLRHDSGVLSVELLKKAHNAGFTFAEAGVTHYFRAYGKSQAINIRRIFIIAGRLARLWIETVLLAKRKDSHALE